MKHLSYRLWVQLMAMIMGGSFTIMAANMSGHHSEEKLSPRHSYANHLEMKVTHTLLDLEIDFDRKVLKGMAELSVKRHKGTVLWLDAQGLKISKVEGDVIGWTGLSTEKFGDPLKIETIDKNDLTVRIHYETSPNAAGLVWLNGNQTRSGMPFMFAMNEPTNYRTMAPGQDTPAVRGTFSANLKIKQSELIKEPFMALISGNNNPKTPNAQMIYNDLKSDVTIPAYLFVLAAGRIKYESLDPKIGFYGDNEKTIKDALVGFSNATRYFDQLEKYLGECKWQRQDFLFLPAMFGFGGMENPGLIYINEGLVEKTGASAYVIAHELAHMKTGNEVTNRNWKAFWLNEGWTTYYEQRLLGDIHGQAFREGAEYEEYLELIAANNERLASTNKLDHQPTHLHKFNTKNIHPDDLTEFSVYPKGANFLKNIELVIGIDKFDTYARNYIKDFSLKPIDTKSFITYSTEKLTALHPKLDWNKFLKEWINKPGLHPEPKDIGVEKVYTPQCTGCEEKVAEFKQHGRVTNFHTWNRFHISHLLHEIKKGLDRDKTDTKDLHSLLNCQSFLDQVAPIIDIRSSWYQALVKGDLWRNKSDEIESFLTNFGRGRVIRPLYAEFLAGKKQENFAFAHRIFTANKDRYFNQVAGSIQGLFAKYGKQ